MSQPDATRGAEDAAPMKHLREISLLYRFAAVVLGCMSLLLFGLVFMLFQQEYRIAVNPRIMGQIERTWIIVRGKHDQHVRVADFTFTVTNAGGPIICQANGLDIGDGAFDAKAGDSIELSPMPGSCARPYVMNIQPPTWVMGALGGIVAVAGLVLALFAWGALGDPDAWPGSWVQRRLRQRFGI